MGKFLCFSLVVNFLVCFWGGLALVFVGIFQQWFKITPAFLIWAVAVVIAAVLLCVLGVPFAKIDDIERRSKADAEEN